MPRARRHIPLLVWLGVSAVLHSGTLGGVREITERIVRSAPPPRVATGSSSIELDFEPADLVRPALPTPPHETTTEAAAVPRAPVAAEHRARAHTPSVTPPPEPPPRVSPPPTLSPTPPTVRAVTPPQPEREQQWAHQAEGNHEAAPDGMLAEVDNNPAEETLRRSEERAAERHIEGRDALNAPGRTQEAPPARPSPRPPRPEAPRAPEQTAIATTTPPAGATVSPREAGSSRGRQGTPDPQGDGRAPGAAGATGALAAAGSTERTRGSVEVASGNGGANGAGSARGEAGQGGADGVGGVRGDPGTRGQGGTASSRGVGGTGDAPTRRVGIEGVGAARALAALTPTLQTLDAVYGAETLERWRREDAQRRADARGDYASNWRAALAAIDTPVAVRPGETTALRTRASPFAAYIVQLHDRIHERFAEGFIGRVMSMPASSPLQDPSLHTELEIVIDRDGSIQRMAVARPSGVLAFDVGALDAVRAAGPFPAPPEVILSGDGRVYVHWNFRRSVNFCNDARPYILRGRGAAGTPSSPGAPVVPAGASESEGRGPLRVPPGDGGVPGGDGGVAPPREPAVPDTPGAQRAV